MQRLLHLVLVWGLIVGFASFEPVSAAQSDDILDLANVPLPVQELPEPGYQVLTGGYLTRQDVAALIADPRNLDQQQVAEAIFAIDISRAYVLDLVLPEDRAWQDSPAIAVLQTNVYLVGEDGSPDDLLDLLGNYANTAFVEEGSPAVPGALTLSMVGEGGDQLRTVVSHGRVVLEIVSLDATGAPSETEHMLIVEATIERLTRLRDEGTAGLSSVAVSMVVDGNTSSFAHAPQTGTHGLYRYRDLGIQPAVGEMDAGEIGIPPGLRNLYLSSEAASIRGGVGLVSIWLAEFDTQNGAISFFQSAVSATPALALTDPYFAIDPGELWVEQGVLGVYRVTGVLDGQQYSGSVEIRQDGNVVVAVGYRTVGAVLPSTDITSSMMDYQLDCIEAQQVCAPFDLPSVTPPPPLMATPVVESGGLGSSEFGWSLPELGPDWTIAEQFAEPGYDRLSLRNGLSIFEIESVVNHHGDPVQCVLDELHMLEEFEQHAVITVWEDAAGITEGGNTDTQAWTVYRVEPLAEERADQEYVIRIDCFSLVQGGANLVVTHIAPVDFWMEERSKGDMLRNSILFPGASGLHGKMCVPAHEWRTAMILIHGNERAA